MNLCSTYLDFKIIGDDNPKLKATNPHSKMGNTVVSEFSSIQGVKLEPMVPCVVKTGVKISLPENHIMVLNSNREMMLKNGITVLNNIIYENGEVELILMWNGIRTGCNTLLIDDKENTIHIPAGTKIAIGAVSRGFTHIITSTGF